jgi:aspartate/methionine/tyrosine aminotransferase
MLARGKALEAKGRSIIHLGIGEPDFDTPAYIRRAADAALSAGYTHYGPAAGLPEFRKLIATTWRERRGLSCDVANVVVTPERSRCCSSPCSSCSSLGDRLS